MPTTTLPGALMPGLAYAGGALLLAAIASMAVLCHPRRHPTVVTVLVIVLIFIVALVATQVDPIIVATLVATAGVVAVRLGRTRSRRI